MKKTKIKLEDFAPVGTTHCEGKCQRQVIVTPDGPQVICHGCKRVVIKIK